MIGLDIRGDIGPILRSLDRLGQDQLPFAMARTVTALAYQVQASERRGMEETLDRPTPFTLNSVRVIAARKGRPIATVFVQDIAAEYLEPFEDGGTHALGRKRAILAPRNARTNQYGNLPRNLTRTLKGRSNVFVGSVKSKKTGQLVSGIWQRPGKGKKAGPPKLLIRFTDPLEVKQHLHYQQRAALTVAHNARPTFIAELNRAMATAR